MVNRTTSAGSPPGDSPTRLSTGFLGAFLALWWVVACGSVDPGAVSLSRTQRIPDPKEFAIQIHPMLVRSCASQACHGRPRPFALNAGAAPADPDSVLAQPTDLPALIQEDYYRVLAYCDLDVPESSLLLRWARDAVGGHTGQEALSAGDMSVLVHWLRTGGGS